MRVCIILNGVIDDYEKTKTFIENEKYNYIICADGGANHLFKMNIIPDYIIGDLDSVNAQVISYYKEKKVDFKKFPSKKNETDTELCILLAQKLKSTHIDFLGALGGRIDHSLANINLLYYVREKNIYPRIISNKEELYIAISESIKIDGDKGNIISVIPIKEDAIGVTLKNLEYPLDNYDMKFSVPLGISNVMLGKTCEINVKHGSLLVIKNIDKL